MKTALNVTTLLILLCSAGISFGQGQNSTEAPEAKTPPKSNRAVVNKFPLHAATKKVERFENGKIVETNMITGEVIITEPKSALIKTSENK